VIWRRWLLAALLLAPVVAQARPAGFQILVDTNQIEPAEAAQAARFAADGVWSIPLNSKPGIDWPKTLAALNARRWSVSEDNPENTSQADFVSAAMHRMVDGAMFYNEDGLATPLSDAQIATDAAHVVPGRGPIGRRVILLTRAFGNDDPRQGQLKRALANPNVAGATFENNAGHINPVWRLKEGCEYILSQGKKCYLLLPPVEQAKDYLSDMQQSMGYFGARLLDSPDVYVVPAIYGRPRAQHYLSTDPTDRNSVEAVVAWLKSFRAGLRLQQR
jgi:hypothetical protein